jgi:hypothetical protein
LNFDLIKEIIDLWHILLPFSHMQLIFSRDCNELNINIITIICQYWKVLQKQKILYENYNATLDFFYPIGHLFLSLSWWSVRKSVESFFPHFNNMLSHYFVFEVFGLTKIDFSFKCFLCFFISCTYVFLHEIFVLFNLLLALFSFWIFDSLTGN